MSLSITGDKNQRSDAVAFTKLKDVVFTFPIIDNHAHPLLAQGSWLTYPLEAAFTEATLLDSQHTIASKSGVKKLGKLYGCAKTFEAVKSKRAQYSLEECSNVCFKAPNVNIQCILLEDGLYGDFKPVENHSGLVDKVRRIVRIERIAENIFEQLPMGNSKIDVGQLETTLTAQLEELAKSENVVAFKSIAAYRSGLDISTQIHKDGVALSLSGLLQKRERDSTSSENSLQRVRIDEKAIIDWVVNIAIKVAARHKIPIQFHTGFGDNDLNLLFSDPLYLKNLIEENLDAKIVLLHAAFPYTKQAAYLATVYDNVFLDIGSIFPQLSHSIQLQTLRDALGICPANKILFSTDGHHVPETFYCAVIEARETLFKVLLESVQTDELDVEEAIEIAKQILFFNSNSLYRLSLIPKIGEPAANPTILDIETTLNKLVADGVNMIRVAWIDLSNIHRVRMVPIERFRSSTARNGLTMARVAMCFPYYSDAIVENTLTAVEEVVLMPDLTTIRPTAYSAHSHVHIFLQNKSDGEPFSLCPRTILKKITDRAAKELNLSFVLGFESEFVLLKKNTDNKFVPIDGTVYAASESFRGENVNTAFEEMVEVLRKQDIVVEQYHSESAHGQFELVTGPDTALESIDKLILTRSTICDVAAKYGFKATFVPKLFRDQPGTGAHMHISLHGKEPRLADSREMLLTSQEQSFIESVLGNIKALCAFTIPSSSSYDRLVDGSWAGTYVGFGFENREVPIRICYRPERGSNVGLLNLEHRFFDGTANPYLAAAAIFAAGISGIKNNLPLTIKQVSEDPAKLTVEERHSYGITEKLPGSLRESLNALKGNQVLKEAFGEELMRCYIGIKEAELRNAENLAKEELLELQISRY